tara:strand:- start:1560 stop:1982 length:423 start_codon:yes stop_codon:yes gene_type:complete
MIETASVQWIESSSGLFHVCAWTDTALIVGFPQASAEISTTFDALIIRRDPIGFEPEIVSLEHTDQTFCVTSSRDIPLCHGVLYERTFETLMAALPLISEEWVEWSAFVTSLYNEAMLESIEAGESPPILFIPQKESIEA